MQLSRAQYQKILDTYEVTRRRHREEQDARTEEVYAKIPRYRELDLLLPDVFLSLGRATITGDGKEADALKTQFKSVSDEKKKLLTSHGYPEDYLEAHYDCPDCRDSGYIDGVRCKCLQNKINAVLYEQSHLSDLIRTNNFSLMRDDFFQGEDLRRFHAAVDICRRFIDTFDTPDRMEGLLFFGSVGSGKSFLSVCTAERILEKGAGVLYFSAVSLFDLMGHAAFRAGEDAVPDTFFDDLGAADLLVIDDLGTELTNAFVSSRLFQLINDRHLMKRATIISTNFDLDELRARYSDRVFSRLMSHYTVCELTGGDVRLMQKHS